MKIVIASLSDLEEVAILFDGYRQFYRQSSDVEAAKSFIRERIEMQESVIICVVEEDGSYAGFTQLYPSFSSVSMAPVWILNDLFVDPAHRRKGLAKLLLDSAADFAREDGALRLALETEVTNEHAIALYEKEGWVRNQGAYFYDLSL